MYNVFLVDDEELVIKSLIASVDWQAFGFQVAGYALSGSEAFEAIRREEPHLVFTDIRMPGMSGLELIKALKDVSSPSLIVVLSGYAEFALAQKAINYGAFGYCLKPFDEIEIAGFLKKAANLLKDRNRSEDADILECLDTDSEENERKLKAILSGAGMDPDDEQGLMAVVAIGKTRLQHESLKRTISIRLGMRKHAYLIRENASLRHELEAYATAGSEMKGVGVSGPIRRLADIRQAIQEGERRAYRTFTAGSDAVSSLRTEVLPGRAQLLKAVDEAIMKRDAGELGDCLDAASLLFAAGRMDIQDALTLFNQTLRFLNREQDELWEEYVYSFDQLTDTYGSVQDMLHYLKDMLAESGRPAKATGTAQVRNRSFKAILDYVERHYRDELSISALSEQFNVNANYISQLFRKETGTTFTQYVTELRVAHACRLLTETDLPINEIAEKSGYSDYFYFTRIFKRAKGTTPSGYRYRQ
ncbi:helix-turn-helix domain-containing protein [Paenibacillus sp. LHD-117]|uniref:response regulator transcription factor n=1 Tax=Paenibacillus sp. LHD-117 TaxID=3071412 RepID=UPI0027DFB963|nr:helix-turn-helix domain-containing protein [Paenibacillus sp. LHD-117]MDQ6417907.1 helix-turn-helix domain-containing protein [Paenibacillus sp. LHD-117]